MGDYTSNYNLYRPTVSPAETGWGLLVNDNFTTIDTLLKTNADAILTVALPTQTGHVGEFLISDGTNASWTAVIPGSLPVQTGHNGEFLTTDGTDASWAAIPLVLPTMSTATNGQYLTNDGTDAAWADIPLVLPTMSTATNGQYLTNDGTDAAWDDVPAQRDIASQAEAEAGTDNTKDMTPLRTAQAITALAPSGGGGGAFNLAYNGDFESWSNGATAAPDYWVLAGAGASVARAGSAKIGAYCMALTNDSGAAQLDNHIGIGKIAYTNSVSVVTVGCWVKASVASRVRLYISDGTSQAGAATTHTGGGAWEWITATHTMVDQDLTVSCYIGSGTGTTAYFDGFIAVEGTTITQFSPKPSMIKENGTVGLMNLVSNGDFEQWNAGTTVAPDYWGVELDGTGSIARDSTAKIGTYSAKLVADANKAASLFCRLDVNSTIDPKAYLNLRGKYVSFSVWVKSNGTLVRAYATDSTSGAYSNYHTGGNGWELLTCTTLISTATTEVTCGVIAETTASVQTSYIDGAMLVEGESSFAFTPRPNSYSDARIYIKRIARAMDAATALVAYTGFGFSPKSIIFMYGFGTTSGSLGMGFDDTVHKGYACVFGGTPITAISGDDVTSSILLDDGSGIAGQLGKIQTLDSDGFTISWTKRGSAGAYTGDVFFMAFR